MCREEPRDPFIVKGSLLIPIFTEETVIARGGIKGKAKVKAKSHHIIEQKHRLQ